MKKPIRLDRGIRRRGRKVELYACVAGKLYTRTIKDTRILALRHKRELWIEKIKRVAEIAKRTGIGAEFAGVTLRQVLNELVRRGLMFRDEKGACSLRRMPRE